VVARIDEYAALGVDEFVLSGWPHLEEVHRVGRQVPPRVAGARPDPATLVGSATPARGGGGTR